LTLVVRHSRRVRGNGRELPTQFGETAAANVGNLTWKNEFVTQMDQVAYRSRQMTPRDDANQLRTRGKRMLELATRAYCEQHHDFARLLTQLATEVFAHARNVEESDALYAARPLRKLPGERRR
jgi:hypothetical protein